MEVVHGLGLRLRVERSVMMGELGKGAQEANILGAPVSVDFERSSNHYATCNAAGHPCCNTRRTPRRSRESSHPVMQS